MDFDLTQEVIDQIIYAMEDQHEVFLVDGETGRVVSPTAPDPAAGEERYVDVPDWRPVDGFQLMERFLATLRNPLLRVNLREALSSGRGVFRSFKDTLRTSPEAEKRWYLFKEREMRRVVYEWYNQMREIRGLEQLPPDGIDIGWGPEEHLLSELSLRVGDPADEPRVLELDRESFREQFQALNDEGIEELYRRREAKHPRIIDPESVVVVAEDRSKPLVGMAWAVYRESSLDGSEAWGIIQLFTEPDFRGLGLGQLLLRRLLRELFDRGARTVEVELVFGTLELREMFARQGFEPASETMRLDPNGWKES